MKSKIFLIIFLLTGCGGGGGDDGGKGSAPVEIIQEQATGILIDSPVEGIRYESSSYSGITDFTGRFDYKPGQVISFYIGEVLIGQVAGQQVITPLHLVNENSLRSQSVINLARLLQTLDEDSDPGNGIKINENTANIVSTFASDGFDFTLDGMEFEQLPATQNIIQQLGKSELVPSEDAFIHLSGMEIPGGVSAFIYAFNASYATNDTTQPPDNYSKFLNLYKKQDIGDDNNPIIERKLVYFNEFTSFGTAFFKPDYPTAYTLKPFYRSELENGRNPNPAQIKVDRGWASLEGVTSEDPTLSFHLSFDSDTHIFYQDDHYITVGIELRFDGDIYEVEANLSDGFLNFSKNNEDIYGNIFIPESPTNWGSGGLDINLPISFFGLSKKILFDSETFAQIRVQLFYRNVDTGLRTWNSSLLTWLFFEEPEIFSPTTVDAKTNTYPDDLFKFSSHHEDSECFGVEFETYALRNTSYTINNFWSIEDNELLGDYSLYDVEFSTTTNGNDIRKNSEGVCTMRLVGNPGITQTFRIEMPSVDLKLTSHDIVRIFSPVDFFYGQNHHFFSTSESDSEYPAAFFYDKNNYVHELLNGNVRIGGGKMKCQRYNCDVPYKPWYGSILLDSNN